jgi:hypothetical protein
LTGIKAAHTGDTARCAGMENTALLFLTLGGLFLAGLVADLFGRRTRLPRVTLCC